MNATLLLVALAGACLPTTTAAEAAPMASGVVLHADTVTFPRLAVELRAGGAVGEARAARGSDMTPGVAWRLGLSFAPAAYIELDGGYGATGFGCRSGLCTNRDVRFTGTGADVAVRLWTGRLRLPAIGADRAWLAAGLARHTLDFEWTDGHGASQADATPAANGWQLGAGLGISLPGRLYLTPGVRYVAYSAAFGANPAEPVGYLAGELGLRVQLR